MQIQNDNQMGKFLTNLTVINRADQILTEAGYIPEDQVRSVMLEDVLVDTGTTTLYLPADVITKLGLKILK